MRRNNIIINASVYDFNKINKLVITCGQCFEATYSPSPKTKKNGCAP
jgi:hypothetical protein